MQVWDIFMYKKNEMTQSIVNPSNCFTYQLIKLSFIMEKKFLSEFNFLTPIIRIFFTDFLVCGINWSLEKISRDKKHSKVDFKQLQLI